MKIIKAFRQKGTNGIIGFTREFQQVNVTFYEVIFSCKYDSYGNPSLYEDDIDFEEITVYSFNRALRLVKHWINEEL